MPLRNDLLNPISPDRPAGENLWYSPTYDKIKEARREDDDAPQGDMTFTRKAADWFLTVKLIGDALATKTKDLQLAAWLAEAMLRREGVAGLRETLDLIGGLIESFWDGLYPELEDGDAEFRASPLRWLGEQAKQDKLDKIALGIRIAPLTRGGFNWLQFRESRKVGSEAAADTYEKQRIRQEALDEGKLAEEVFDKDFDSTPKKFYVDLAASFDGALESLDRLSQICDEKFGDVSPSFGYVKGVLEEVRQTVRILLAKKREKEPDAVEAPAAVAPPEGVAEEAVAEAAAPAAAVGKADGSAAAPARKPVARASAELATWQDAVEQVVAVAAFMRKQDPYNPAPYLILRGLRWGELRASGKTIDQTRLSAPPAEIRQTLRRQVLDANWTGVLETAETAVGMECGRGWLDLQRYFARACSELGGYYVFARRAVLAALKDLLAAYPDLPGMTMMDDMPAANAETLAWLEEEALLGGEPSYDAAASSSHLPRAVELAIQANGAGRPEAGMELLTREISREPSGRGRFQRRIQLAQLLVAAENDAMAITMLQHASAEIDEKKLEEWEAGETLAAPLALLYACLTKSGDPAGERDRLYSSICRMDPLEAMKLER